LRRRSTLFFPLLLASIIAIGIGAAHFTRGADAAGAILYHPSADCSTNPANVTFNWAPLAGATSQALQVSDISDGFAEGTYTEVSLSGTQETYTMGALAREVPSYWRIVSTSSNGESVSEAHAFVACGAPFLLWGPLECRNFTSAAVDFRWAPAANYVGEQYIEFDSNGDWAGDDHWQVGPLSPSDETERHSDFQDGVGYLFRIVHVVNGQRSVSSEGWFMPDCSPDVNPEPYGTDDRLIVPSIGVDAPVNIRDVGADGVLGVPAGGYDVVRYNFAYYPELQGQIGGPGPTLIGGHLDYYVIGPAVFWDLAKIKVGDQIQYWDGGVEHTYVVDWTTALPYTDSLNSYLQGSDAESLMLITCYGVFDRDEYGGYNQRTLIHAVPQ
jgi:sortase (surface protein transpeptidase)